jgi:hypothetical protein
MRVEHVFYYYPRFQTLDIAPDPGKFVTYCNPLSTPPPLVNIVNPIAIQTKSETDYTNYSTVSELILNILRESPRIIAFGEIHPFVGDPKNTLEVFTAEILPQLAESGITELIVEQIFSDPQVEEDLAKFYETGALNSEDTPALYSNLTQYHDSEDLIDLLLKARELGVRVHPGGVSFETAEETVFQPDFTDREDLHARARAEITRNILERATQLVVRGKRIAIYSGLSHNDIHPTRSQVARNLNFGRALAERVGDGYYEVDLVLPYSLGMEEVSSQVRVENTERMIPESGVNVVERGNSYTVFFPRVAE